MQHITGDGVNDVFTKLVQSYLPGVARDTFTQDADIKDEFRFREVEDESSPDVGKRMLEQGFLLEVKNPRDRLIVSKRVDLFNMVGLWIYLLSGSRSRRFIEFYNEIGRKFIDEEMSVDELRGNWGERLFASGAVSNIIAHLRTHPSSRRAVIPVFTQEDIGVNSRNLPCLIAVQFAQVGKRLDMFATMRSQAAVGVVPYDLFVLTMLHEYIALRVGSSLGRYYHFAPITGIREHEVATVWSIEKNPEKFTLGGTEMSPMPNLPPGQKAIFLDCEAMIRRGNPKWEELASLLPKYWRGLLAITMARWMVKNDKEFWGARLADAADPFPTEYLLRYKESLEAVKV